jgi:bifunctional DNA-binding transcriptional regulator/antitoxin component of YhaV-PrlF toxin-antitoxin module
MAKLQQTKDHFFITIPAKIVKLLHWQKGDNIELESDFKGKLYLIKK